MQHTASSAKLNGNEGWGRYQQAFDIVYRLCPLSLAMVSTGALQVDRQTEQK